MTRTKQPARKTAATPAKVASSSTRTSGKDAKAKTTEASPRRLTRDKKAAPDADKTSSDKGPKGKDDVSKGKGGGKSKGKKADGDDQAGEKEGGAAKEAGGEDDEDLRKGEVNDKQVEGMTLSDKPSSAAGASAEKEGPDEDAAPGLALADFKKTAKSLTVLVGEYAKPAAQLAIKPSGLSGGRLGWKGDIDADLNLSDGSKYSVTFSATITIKEHKSAPSKPTSGKGSSSTKSSDAKHPPQVRDDDAEADTTGAKAAPPSQGGSSFLTQEDGDGAEEKDKEEMQVDA